MKFQVRSGGKILWLTNAGIVFDSIRTRTDSSSTQPRSGPPEVQRNPTPPDTERLVFAENLVGANANATVEPVDPQPGVYNYMQTSDSSKWHTGVRAYGGVIYHGIWDGIDLRLFAHGGDIEQEFLVHPGAVLAKVRVEYRGIEELHVAEDGSLVVHTKFGDLRESKPRLYQEIAGERVAVNGRFVLASKSAYGFEVKGQSSEYALLIDPTLLYSSFLGGSADDLGGAIAVDSSGSAYLAGSTTSSDFPVTSGAFVGPRNGRSVFVTKVSPLGDKLIYSAILGPGAPNAIAVDSQGDAFVVGGTSIANPPYPTTPNAYQSCPNIVSNFLTKLSPGGGALLYSTCIGWGDGYGAKSVAIDGAGKVYMTGATSYDSNHAKCVSVDRNLCSAPFLTVIDPSVSGVPVPLLFNLLSDRMTRSTPTAVTTTREPLSQSMHSARLTLLGPRSAWISPSRAALFRPQFTDGGTCARPRIFERQLHQRICCEARSIGYGRSRFTYLLNLPRRQRLHQRQWHSR